MKKVQRGVTSNFLPALSALRAQGGKQRDQVRKLIASVILHGVLVCYNEQLY